MKRKRKTPEDYHTLAERRGLRWLGPFPRNTTINTTWECSLGHQWKTKYGHIQNGTGCPTCVILNRKLALTDYHSLAKERDLKWLGPEVLNCRIKTMWKCGEGHEWKVSYDSIKQERGCPHCYNKDRGKKLRYTPADYHALAERRGFKWLDSEVPQNTNIKTWWECPRGHQWKSRYDSIRIEYGCPYCAGLFPKVPEDYYILASRRGFQWLGPFPSGVHETTLWECSGRHQWAASFRTIDRGSGCPYCAGLAPKTPNDYHILAKKHNIKWLGPEIQNTKTKTGWECRDGHTWETTYGEIKQGYGCPRCANETVARKLRKKPIDYYALAEERNFQWLGPEGHNVFCKTWWECPDGHRWETCYSEIQQGRGCPECIDMVNGRQVSGVQRQLCAILNGELNYPCGSYRIDVALLDEMIAIEYDSWFWHGGRQDYEAERDEFLIGAGWKVLHVKSNLQLPNRKILEAAIARLRAGQKRIEIILDDWGDGPTFVNL